jgi:hypothetical protein
MFTEVAMRRIDENVALPSDNQNIFNENEMNNSPKENGVTSGGHTPNINPTSERPGFIGGDRNQLKKSSKKEGSSSRSKEIGKKTSVKDVLSDDSGTNDLVSCMILRGRIHYEFWLTDIHHV